MEDNETWLLDTGDLVIRKKIDTGYEALSDIEKAIYSLWVIDYAVRNSGTLIPVQDLHPMAIADLLAFARFRDCRLLSALFDRADNADEFCESYYDEFEGACGELRTLWERQNGRSDPANGCN